jgi:hypothetical protein
MVCAAALTMGYAQAQQLGPVQHDGYLEYQYRLSRAADLTETELHLATWRAQASTFVWKPYILLLDGNLGLTESRTTSTDIGSTNSIITGGLAAKLFPRSRFPFRAFFEARDSRVDGDVVNIEMASQNWGFWQQYAWAGGGRLSLEFRNSDTQDLRVDSPNGSRDFGSSIWQLNGAKSIGSNSFDLLASVRDVSRERPMQMEKRRLFNLRHRFRPNPRFFIEDTTFFSDERITYDNSEIARRFLQFNGNSNWRPDTVKPLLVIARVVAQGIDSGRGDGGMGSQALVLTGSANYQYSPRISFAGNVAIRSSEMDDAPGDSSVLQRLRATYRSANVDLGPLVYVWGGSVEAGNRRNRSHGDDTVQDLAAVFNHGLGRNTVLRSGRILQINFSQAVSAVADTDDRREQTAIHSAYISLNRQNGRTSSYIRLSASDRRSFGDRDDSFQLFNLQASSRMQISRKRAWNGSLTIQYSNSAATMSPDHEMDNSALTYSVDLRYTERDLFNVDRLNFSSELRLLSANFRNDNVLNEGIAPETDRDDSNWRNELNYRIGLLEFRLFTDMRRAESRWTSQVFFMVRRYYGVT